MWCEGWEVCGVKNGSVWCERWELCGVRGRKCSMRGGCAGRSGDVCGVKAGRCNGWEA